MRASYPAFFASSSVFRCKRVCSSASCSLSRASCSSMSRRLPRTASSALVAACATAFSSAERMAALASCSCFFVCCSCPAAASSCPFTACASRAESASIFSWLKITFICRCTSPLTATLATPVMPSILLVSVFSTNSESSATSILSLDTAATATGSMVGLIFST